MMQIVPRHKLPTALRTAGLDVMTREFPDSPFLHSLTLRECVPAPWTPGPHRKIVFSDGRVEGPFPLSDRPALSHFVGRVFAHLEIPFLLATVAEGAFWLNNKALANYLARVPDARRATTFLQARCLTDRFQGGFCVRADGYSSALPLLALHPFVGGGNVQFASLAPHYPLTIVACHHFDLHVVSPLAGVVDAIAELAYAHGLCSDMPSLPDLPLELGFWPADPELLTALVA